MDSIDLLYLLRDGVAVGGALFGVFWLLTLFGQWLLRSK